jgi:hypothetical protein
VRAFLLSLLLLFAAASGVADAQVAAPLDVGSPDAAFAGGPIKLSKISLALLREHYQGDKVPLVPQPWRGRLDTALIGGDWPRAEAVKKELIAARGLVMALAWEQSRFVATGSIGVAEMHAQDLAATGSSGVSETAVMLWLYAVAVSMTDGHKCSDDTAKDTYLDQLRGPAFAPVLRLVQSLADDRLAAMRDLAVRLENVLAPERTDDTMCRGPDGRVSIRSDLGWKTDAALTRQMLPRHLLALTSVMRPKPIARPEPPKPDVTAIAKPAPPSAPTDPMPPRVFAPDQVLALPVPFTPNASAPAQSTPATVAVPAARTAAGNASRPALGPSGQTPVADRNDPVAPQNVPAVANPAPAKSDPARFEPPQMELTPSGR